MREGGTITIKYAVEMYEISELLSGLADSNGVSAVRTGG